MSEQQKSGVKFSHNNRLGDNVQSPKTSTPVVKSEVATSKALPPNIDDLQLFPPSYKNSVSAERSRNTLSNKQGNISVFTRYS